MQRGAWLLIAWASVVTHAQPRIESVSPAEVSIAGGVVVTVRGSGFSKASLTLDRVPITPLSHSDTEVSLLVPARDNGYATIALGTASGATYGEFLYVPPDLTDLAPGAITTVAGVGVFSGDYRPGSRAMVTPWGLAVDDRGYVYIAEAANDRVVRVRPDGVIEPFAGNGECCGPRPTAPTDALHVSISYPRGMAADRDHNVYIPDSNHYLYRVTPGGTAEIIAGTGQAGFSGDGGPASAAQLGHPNFVAVDGAGNVYLLCFSNARIRKIDRNGIITTVAGTGTAGFSGDGGPATQAQFDIPGIDQGGLAADEAGNLFLLDYSNARIRRIDAASGVITTLVSPELAGTALNDLKAVAVAKDGSLYFSQAGSLIFRRSPDGTITQLTAGGRGGFSPDGTLLRDALLGGVAGLAINGAGELLVSDGSRVRKVDASGRLQTVAGVGPGRIDEGQAALGAVIINTQVDLDFLPDGQLIFGDADRLRKIDDAGVVTTIAGGVPAGPFEDVPALEAELTPSAIEVAADGSIDFVSGFGTYVIGMDGIVRRTSGVFTLCDYTGDGGNALDARFCQMWDAVRDRNGNLLIADTNNNRIRRVDRATGIVTTIAGSGAPNGWEGYGQGQTCGDGGPATQACLNTPYGVVEDDAGNIYVSHVDVNGRIRRIDPSGTITTFSENVATKMTLLHDVLYGVAGDRVLRFSSDGAPTVIAGTPGQSGFAGDGGPATQSRINAKKSSHGVAIDPEGNLFFSDGDNRRIRAVRYGAVLPPAGATIVVETLGRTIRATVRDAEGRPAPAVRIDFTSPATGASCNPPNRFAITDAAGVASVPCSPNCVAGSFDVIVRPVTGSAAASVSFTNPGGPCRRRAVRH